MTLAELAAIIEAGELSPVELVDAYLVRIEALDPVLEAFNTVVADAAREMARSRVDEEWRGPLHGIPLAIKDNFYTRGVPTTANSHIFADFVPAFDASAWRRLREGGAVLLGKTQMGPLATSRATTPDGDSTTVNAWAPFDDDVSPGGSSSGSATAVAARLAASSVGTQTGGSITNPSARQGLTGLKPTMGRVSLHGIIPLTYTRDHAGPLARDALDAALMLQAMAGPDPLDARTQGLPPVPDYGVAADPVRRGSAVELRWPTTIGVIPGYLEVSTGEEGEGRFRRGVESEVQRERLRRVDRARREAEVAARRAMLATFESMGARILEIEFPPDWETLTRFEFNNVRLPERSEPFLEHLRRDVRLFGVSLAPWINGLLLSGPEYLRGQRAKMLLLRRVLEDIFGQCDAVVQTSSIPFDMIGLPLITFPIGFEQSQGMPLPVGGLIGGLPFGEERLISLAAAYQSATRWHRRRPADPEVDAPGASGRRTERRRLDVLDVMMECE
jgi:Asp-tRNA(Asn)/Glu-tRNA(Gln) amidotransferase A subunit family amidase